MQFEYLKFLHQNSLSALTDMETDVIVPWKWKRTCWLEWIRKRNPQYGAVALVLTWQLSITFWHLIMNGENNVTDTVLKNTLITIYEFYYAVTLCIVLEVPVLPRTAETKNALVYRNNAFVSEALTKSIDAFRILKYIYCSWSIGESESQYGSKLWPSLLQQYKCNLTVCNHWFMLPD